MSLLMVALGAVLLPLLLLALVVALRPPLVGIALRVLLKGLGLRTISVTCSFSKGVLAVRLVGVQLHAPLLQRLNFLLSGRLPLEIRSASAQELRIHADFMQFLRSGGSRVEALGFCVLGHMLHVGEMDEERMRTLAVQLKRSQADITCAMLDEILRGGGQQQPPPPQARGSDNFSWMLLVFDWWFSNLCLEILAMHLRVDDPRSRSCMGLNLGRLSCQPLPPVKASLGAPHRRFELVELKFYVDPTLDVWPPTSHRPHMYILQAGMLAIEMDLPEIATLWSRGVTTRDGKGKRFRLMGTCFGLQGKICPIQMRHLLYHSLYVFYGGEGRSYKYHVVNRHVAEECRPLSSDEQERYIELDAALHEETGPSAGRGPVSALRAWFRKQKRKLMTRELAKLEEIMSYAEIVQLRCESRLYSVPPGLVKPGGGGGAEAIALQWRRDEELMKEPGHPQHEEYAALADLVGQARARRDHDDASMREVLLERIRFENLEVELYGEPPPGTGPTDFYRGQHEITLHAAAIYGHVRTLLAVSHLTGMCVGAKPGIQEPAQAWLDVAGYATRYIFVNERRSGDGSLETCVTPFMLGGPCQAEGGVDHGGFHLGSEQEGECHLHVSYRRWSTGRSELDVGFHNCRLAVYYDRVMEIISECIRPFRQQPHERLWMNYESAADFKDMQYVTTPRDELARKGGLPPILVPPPDLSLIHRSLSASSEMEDDPSLAAASNTIRSPGIDNNDKLKAPYMRLFESRTWQFNLQLHRCELILVADITDPDSCLVVAEITGAGIINSEVDRESIDIQLNSLRLTPAVPDDARDWFWSDGLPHLLPTGLHEKARGIRTSQRAMLEPISATVSNSFERGRLSDLLLAPSSSATLSPLTSMEGDAKTSLEDIPRFLHILIKELRFTNLPPDYRGLLVQSGVMVTCNGQNQSSLTIGREPSWLAGESSRPRARSSSTISSSGGGVIEESSGVLHVSKEFAFLYTGVRPRITVDIGESSYVPAGEWVPQLAASFEIEGDQDPNTAGSPKLYTAPLTSQEKGGELQGEVTVQVLWAFRLLVVTVHRVQHLVEPGGGDADDDQQQLEAQGVLRPFIAVSVGGSSVARTDEFQTVPDADVDHDFAFRTTELEPIISLSLVNRGRVQDLLLGSILVRFNRDMVTGEWFRLKGKDGSVVCELKASFYWVESADMRGATSSPPLAAMAAEDGGAFTNTQASLDSYQLNPYYYGAVEASPNSPDDQLSELPSDLGAGAQNEPVGGRASRASSAAASDRSMDEDLLSGGADEASSLPVAVPARIRSFEQAVETFRHQNMKAPDDMALVRSVGLEFHVPVTVRLSDQDIAAVKGILQSFKRKTTPQPEQSTSQQSAEQVGRGSAQRQGKRELHRLFKSLDHDHDGRLDGRQVADLLRTVASGLPLTLSEVNDQVTRLLLGLGVAEEGDATLNWKEFRDALTRCANEYNHSDGLETVRCGEYASTVVMKEVLGARIITEPLPVYLAQLDPVEDLPAFWSLFETETGACRGQAFTGASGHYLQLKLLRTLKHYTLAKHTWRLLVLPAIFNLPEVRGVNREGYELMGAPVGVGDAVYSDLRVEVTSLPSELEKQVLTGIRTLSKDRRSTGQRFLTFTLTMEAHVYVCYDNRIPRLPKWLVQLGFKESLAMGHVRTTQGSHRVFSKLYRAGPVVLGGNEGRIRGCNSYFVLIGRHPPARPAADGGPPPWLLNESSPATVGISKSLHSHLFVTLGIETDASRATEQAQRAAATQVRRGADGVEQVFYRLNVSCPGLAVHLVDFRRVFSERFTARIKWATVGMTLEHSLASGQDWLGQGDRLVGHVSFSSEALYFNSTLGAHEYALEPWECHCSMENARDSPITAIRLTAERHCNFNLAPPLFEVLRSFIYRPPRLDASRYRQALSAQAAGAKRHSRVLLINRLGVPLVVRSSSESCRLVAGEGGLEDEEEGSSADGGGGVVGQAALHLELTHGHKGVCWLRADPPEGGESEKPMLSAVPKGWKAVRGIRVGTRGSQGFRLVLEGTDDSLDDAGSKGYPPRMQSPQQVGGGGGQEEGKQQKSRPTTPKRFKTGRGSSKSPARFTSVLAGLHPHQHQQDTGLGRHMLLVVDAKEATPAVLAAAGVSGSGANGQPIALVMEFRTNIRVANLTSLAVEASVTMVDAVKSSGAGGSNNTTPLTSPSGTHPPARGTRLQPYDVLSLPLAMAGQRPWLRVTRFPRVSTSSPSPERGGAVDSFLLEDDEPHPQSQQQQKGAILLPPALFDPATPHALRRTRALEERALSLQHKTLSDSGGTGGARPHHTPERIGDGGDEHPSGGAAGSKSKPRKKKGEALLDWTIAILPPYHVVNSLPCPIQVQAFQPQAIVPKPSSPSSLTSPDQQPRSAGGRRATDPALDLFLLPGGLAALAGGHHTHKSGGGGASGGGGGGGGGQVPAISSPPRAPPKRSMTRINSMGALDAYGLGGLMKDEPVEQAQERKDDEGEDEMDDEDMVGDGEDNEADSPTEVVWEGTIESGTYENLERVDLERSLYLRIRLLPGKGPWSTSLRIPSAAHLDRSLFHVEEEAVFNGSAAGASQDHADVRMTRRWKLRGTRRVMFFSEYWILNKTGLALSYLPTPDDFGGGRDWGRDLVLSDRDHTERFGLGTRMPVMLSCPLKTLRAMPYDRGTNATKAGLYLTELTVRPSLLHYVNSSFAEGSRLFADSPITVTSLPPPLQDDAGPRRLAVVTQRQRDASILLPGGETGLSFRISEGAYVHVCLEERYTKGERRPPWLASQGFRAAENCPLLSTSEPGISYMIFSRFFSAGSVVELGLMGLSADKAAQQVVADASSSAARLLLRATSKDEVGAATSGAGGHKNLRGSSQSDWPFFVVVTEPGERGSHESEVDVQCLEVQRDMRDQIWCRAQYAILPAVRPGDRPYVDRNKLTLKAFPPAFQSRPLIAIQTAQSDRRSSNGFTVRFTVLQESWVVLGFDSRGKSLPYWVYSQGFQDLGIQLPGLEEGYDYDLYQKHVPAHATVCLGGNSATGARGLRRMYVVFVTQGEPICGNVVVPRTEPLVGPATAATKGDLLVPEEGDKGELAVSKQGGEEGGGAAFSGDKQVTDRASPTDSVTTTAASMKRESSREGRLSALAEAGLDAEPTANFWGDGMSKLDMMSPLFDLEGRSWSAPFNVDAVNTTGQLETSCAVLGVSIKPLPGLFQRTKAVTLFPRFVVVNQLSCSIEVLPILRPPPPKTGLAAILPAAFATQTDQGRSGGRTSRGASAAPSFLVPTHLEEAECVSAVEPGQCMAIYSFLGLQHLHPSLLLPPGYLRREYGWSVQGDDDGQEKTRAICLRLHSEAGGSKEASFSQPIAVEEVGETVVWLWRDNAARHKGPLVASTVTVEGPTVFVTLKDVSTCPPYRIENRSSWATLMYKQQGTEVDMTALEPMSWHAFTWQELDDVRKLKVAVKGYETESSSYALDEVGPKDWMTVGKAFLGNSSREYRLYVEVTAVGHTRVISFSDVRGLSRTIVNRTELSTVALLKDMYKFLDIEVDFAGLTVNLLEVSPEGSIEIAAVTVDRIRLDKEGGRDRADFSIHHLQMDDLRSDSRMPVILQPADSGFNTEKRLGSAGEGGRRVGFVDQQDVNDEEHPFFRAMLEPNLLSPGVTHYRGVEMLLKEIELHVDLDYLLYLIAYLGRLRVSDPLVSHSGGGGGSTSRRDKERRRTPGGGLISKIDENSRHVVRKLLHAKLSVPERVRRSGPSFMVYLELFHHSSLVVTVEFLAGPKQALDFDPGAGLDEALESGLEVLGAGFVQFLGAVARSVAQLCPTFVFNELLLTHYFGSPGDLARIMRLSMRQQAVTQSYKLLGSMDILGNPISLVNKMGNGVVEFFRRTGAEMVGDSDNPGEGLRKLVQGVVGGAFGSAAKITGTVAGLVEGVTGLQEQDALQRSRGTMRERPQHLGDGIVQGGQIFYNTMRTGVAGLVDRPREGAHKEGFAGLLKGIGKGLVGAVAAPVVGTLGAFSRVTEGVDATTYYFDQRRGVRRRRQARLAVEGKALPLLEEDLLGRVDQHHSPRPQTSMQRATRQEEELEEEEGDGEAAALHEEGEEGGGEGDEEAVRPQEEGRVGEEEEEVRQQDRTAD